MEMTVKLLYARQRASTVLIMKRQPMPPTLALISSAPMVLQ